MLVARSALRSTAFRPVVQSRQLYTSIRRQPKPLSAEKISRVSSLTPLNLLNSSVQSTIIRGAASSVANRPGSQTIPHAAQNIKEELGHSIEEVAKTISGGATTLTGARTAGESPDGTAGTKLEGGFLDITTSIAATVPTSAMIFGLSGSIPFIGTSAATVYYAKLAGEAASAVTPSPNIDVNAALATLEKLMEVEVTYGAVMLGFLGALHWGMEFAGYGGQKGSKRLMLGIAPTLVGWSTLALDPSLALAVQWAGFTGLWFADMKATSAGWTPPWYSQYRFYLSILVGTCIIGTLAGTSYYGPTQAHSKTLKELNALRQAREIQSREFRNQPVAPGEVGSTSGVEEGADVYVIVKHAPEPKEKKEKEGKEGKDGKNAK